MNDVAVNKKESIERCIKQIHTYYHLPDTVPFEKNLCNMIGFRNILVSAPSEQVRDLQTLQQFQSIVP